MKEQADDRFIDLEKIISEKNPRLLRILPGFVLRYIRNTIHEDEINAFIRDNKHWYGIDFARAILRYFNIQINIRGAENIPLEGGAIIASNHPLGGLDAIALIDAVSRQRKDIRFLVNDILMHLENLRPIFVPVNKLGRNSPEILEAIDHTFASNQLVLVFPAGLVSRKQEGMIRDLEWKKSFITMAKKYRKDVIPVHINGANSSFFYNLALWRKRIGIKANIEMFYLPDEMFRQRDRVIDITFGRPVPWHSFSAEKKDREWAEKIKEKVYLLKETS